MLAIKCSFEATSSDNYNNDIVYIALILGRDGEALTSDCLKMTYPAAVGPRVAG